MSVVERFLTTVDALRPDLVDLTRQLVQRRSENPPGTEEAVSELVADRMRSLGLRVELVEPHPGRVNTLGTLEGVGGGTTLLFNGHYDTVPAGEWGNWSVDPFEGVVDGGWMMGRGAADEKGAIAAVITAVKALRACGVRLRGDLHVHAVADEEAGSRYGTRYLIEKGFVKADMGVVMEGSVFDRRIYVRTAVRGLHWVEITTKGRSCHGSKPRFGVNAVLKMAKILLALDKHVLNHPPHRLLPAPTIAAGTLIRGGTKENIIPEACTAVCDIRTVPGMTEDGVLGEVRKVITDLRQEDGELEAEVKTRFWWPSAEVSEDAAVVELAKRATRRVMGYEVVPRGTSGSNDSTFLNSLANIPTIAFGPADQLLSRAHGADERVEVRQLVNFAKIYGLMAMEACGTA